MTTTQSLATPPAFELRPYQEEAILTVLAKKEEGVLRQLGVAATGLGKTILFAELARRMNVRTIILTHRDELIQQAIEKLGMVWPGVSTGVVKAERNEHTQPLVVASIQTASRVNRLKTLPKDFELVISDEAHHARSETWMRVLDHLGCDGSAGSPLSLGVTATPDRGDKKGLISVYDEVVFSYDLRWGIEQGYLSDIKAKQVLVEMDLDSVKTRNGDYADGDLGEALHAANAPEHAVTAWIEHAKDRKTLAFTPTVALAVELADEFKSRGYRAAWISGETPLEQRRQTLRDFTDGKIQILTNCGIAVEGFDEPSIECVLVARPTKSRSFLVQMVGRGTRRFPGKNNCLVLDVVGTAKRHSLATPASLLGVSEAEMEKGASARTLITKQNEKVAEKAKVYGNLITEDLNLWDEKFQEAEFSWVQASRSFALSLGDGIITLERSGENWNAILKPRKGTPQFLTPMTGSTLGLAQGAAEDYVRRQKATTLVDRSAMWRQNPASPKQIAALSKWRIPFYEGMTAGEASDLMTSKIASRKG